ncbi:MAG: O-antigen ligase family protein [Patescibacteria group bacterium]
MVWKGLYYEFTTTEAFFVMGVVEVMVLCFIWAAYKDPQVRPRLGLVGKAFLVFVAILVLASAFGVDPTLSFWSSFDRLTGVVFWFHLSALFVVGSGILRTSEDWRRLFFCSTFVGFFVSVFHLLSFAGFDGVWLVNRSATIGNSTFFAVYILFQLAFSLLILVRASGIWRAYAIFVAIVFAMAIYTSEAQAVILSSVGGLVLIVALMGVRRGKAARVVGISIIAVLVLAFFVGLLGLFQPSSAVRQWLIEHSSGSRFTLWEIAGKGIEDRPLLGWGSENFGSVFTQYYNPCFGSFACGAQNLFDRAHNKVLDVLVETGVVGLLGYLAIFVAAIWSLWRRNWEPRDALIPMVVTGALAAYVVQDLVALDVPLTLLFLVFLLLFTDQTGSTAVLAGKKRRFMPMAVPVCVTIFVLVVFFVNVIQPLRANLSVAQWFEADSDTERLAALDRATGLSKVGIEDRLAFMARQSAGKLWIESIKGEAMTDEAGEETVLLYDRLLAFEQTHSLSLSVQTQLGFVLHTSGKFFDEDAFQAAENVLQEAIDRYPNHPQPRWALASVYLEQGKMEQAIAITQAAFDLDPAVVESHIQRLIAVKFSQNQELFMRYVQEAMALSPESEAEIRLIYEADLARKRDQLLFELY